MLLKYILLEICCVSVSNCAAILAIIPTPCYSHQIAFSHLWKELSLRGHQVTVITANPIKDPKLVNLTEIDMNFTYKRFANISKVAEHDTNMWTAYNIILNLTLGVTNDVLAHPPVQELIHNRKVFDVVLVEFMYPEFLIFAELYDCPKILISSMDAYRHIHYAVGNPTHPVLYPEVFSDFVSENNNFGERILSVIHTLYVNYLFLYVAFPMRENSMGRYLNNSKTIVEMLADIDMVFVNVNPVVESVRAVGPSTINIFGFRRDVSPKPLTKDLEQFLDNATDGFIYFSLGSNVKSKELARPTFRAIFETLSEMPYKVLWKYEDDTLPDKPDHIRLIKWAPQQQVLSHPNIKVFVTQGGLQSMEEGFYREVPFVVIPFFADQEHNAKLMSSKGFAKIVHRKPSVNKEELKGAILEVINNPRYKNSIRRLKQLAVDSPMSGLEKAIWWTEYVIRHKGAKHLRNPAADLPLYQYYLLDVIGFFIITTGLLIYIAVIMVKIIHRIIMRKIIGSNLLQQKKSQ